MTPASHPDGGEAMTRTDHSVTPSHLARWGSLTRGRYGQHDITSSVRAHRSLDLCDVKPCNARYARRVIERSPRPAAASGGRGRSAAWLRGHRGAQAPDWRSTRPAGRHRVPGVTPARTRWAAHLDLG